MSPTNDVADGRAAQHRPWGAVRGRGGRFHVRFTHDGREYERGKFSTWAAADKMRRRARTLLEAGTPIAEVLAACFGEFYGAAVTFRDAVPLYLQHAKAEKRPSTLRADTSRLQIATKAGWTAKVLGKVTTADLVAWAAERRKAGSLRGKPAADPQARRALSPSAINRDLSIVSAVFEWAKTLEYVTANPARAIKQQREKGRARETHLTSDEARALVAAASPAVRPIILAALHTGMRRGELLALRWRSVDVERRAIVVEAETEKAGRGRVVPMTAELHAVLRALARARPKPAMDGSDPVFTVGAGEPLLPGALRVGFADAVARTAAVLTPTVETDEDRRRAAGWLGKRDLVTFHVLRHTAASLMVGAGVPLFDVAKILGHSTLAVTMRYAHFAPEAGRSAIEALGTALAGATAPRTAAGAPEAAVEALAVRERAG